MSRTTRFRRNSAQLAAALVIPLVLSACGDSDNTEPYAADNIEADGSGVGTGVNTASSGSTAPGFDNLEAANAGLQSLDPNLQAKDQVNTASAGTASTDVVANKLNETTASTNTSTPTEKVDDETSTTETASASAAAGVNSVQTVIEDMELLNDAPLKGVDPSFGFARGPGFNVMGNNASSEALPSWFTTEFPELAASGAWNAILPWFVMFEGEANAAGNVSVQMRGLKVYVLSRATDQWTQVIDVADIDGEMCPVGDNTTPCSAIAGKSGETDGVSVPVVAGQNLHGWFGERTQINGADVAAVFVTMQSRLAGEAADLAAAQYLIDVGADYYPDLNSQVPYVPGVGVSRAKLLTGEWQSFNFMTFSDVGQQEPGGGITSAQFSQNPPPLD